MNDLRRIAVASMAPLTFAVVVLAALGYLAWAVVIVVAAATVIIGLITGWKLRRNQQPSGARS
jgi:O-antigen/teichoic acid export membrane protein